MKQRSDNPTLKETASVKEACKVLSEEAINAMLLTNTEGAVVGLVSERDIVKALAKDAGVGHKEIGSLMINKSKFVTCEQETPVCDMMEIMLANNIRHLAVKAPGSQELSGFVSLKETVACANTLRALDKAFEQECIKHTQVLMADRMSL